MQAMVYNTVLGILQQAEEAEDISQEVFIEVYRSIGSFKGDAKLSTWIYRISITKALDRKKYHQRKKRSGGLLGLFRKNDDLPLEIPDMEHPGVVLANKERSVMLFKALNSLPEDQRVAFVLQKMEGLSQRDIGDILQRSEGAVESLLQRAKINLRRYLTEI